MLKRELGDEMKVLSSIVIISLFGVASLLAADVEVTKGRLFEHSPVTTQVISATNNTKSMIDTIWIECGFFRNGVLLAAEKQYAENVQPGQTIYIEITSLHAQGADQTDCRVSKIY
jgi:hypothetical protein